MVDAPRAHRALFDDDYVRVLAPFHTEEEARWEAAALRELLGLAQSDRILDLGCGWGRHLRLLADAGHRVCGIDLSEPLLRRATADGPLPVAAADMLRLPFPDARFDVVLFNPPYLQGEPRSRLEAALYATDTVARFAGDLRRHLRPGGSSLVVLSSLGPLDQHLGCFADAGIDAEVVARRRLPGEVLSLHRLAEAER